MHRFAKMQRELAGIYDLFLETFWISKYTSFWFQRQTYMPLFISKRVTEIINMIPSIFKNRKKLPIKRNNNLTCMTSASYLWTRYVLYIYVKYTSLCSDRNFLWNVVQRLKCIFIIMNIGTKLLWNFFDELK